MGGIIKAQHKRHLGKSYFGVEAYHIHGLIQFILKLILVQRFSRFGAEGTLKCLLGVVGLQGNLLVCKNEAFVFIKY